MGRNEIKRDNVYSQLLHITHSQKTTLILKPDIIRKTVLKSTKLTIIKIFGITELLQLPDNHHHSTDTILFQTEENIYNTR